MSLSRPIGRALAGGPLALLVLALPATLAAQGVPRVLLSVGGGTVPRDDGTVDRGRAAGLTASAGVRVPVWRRTYVEATAQAQGALDFNESVTLDVERGTGAIRTLTTKGDAGTGVAFLARVGAEALGGGRRPTLRAAAGAGTMRLAIGPVTTVTAGLSSPGRRTRLTLDVDGWWYRVRAVETTLLAPSAGVSGSTSRGVRVPLRSTFVRAGVEVALGRP